jgi:hypothetical protein
MPFRADSSGPDDEDERTPPAEERVERFLIFQAEVMGRHEERLLRMAQLAATKAERENRLKARLGNLEKRIETVRGAEGVDGGALKRLREDTERLRARRAQDDGGRTAERDGRAAAMQYGAHQTDEGRRARFDVLQAEVMARHRERVLRMAEFAARRAGRGRERIRAADTGTSRGPQTTEANRKRAGAKETRVAEDVQRRLAEEEEQMRRAAEEARAQAVEAERRAAEEARARAERRWRAAEEARATKDGRTPSQRLSDTLGLLAEDVGHKGRGRGSSSAAPAETGERAWKRIAAETRRRHAEEVELKRLAEERSRERSRAMEDHMRRLAKDAARLAERKRLAEQERQRLAEERRLAEETERRCIAEETARRRLARETRIAEETEQRCIAEETARRRLAREKRVVEETARRRMNEEKRLADEAVRQQRAPEQSRLQDEKLLETLHKLGIEAKRHFVFRKTTADNATLSKLGIPGIEAIPLTQPIIKHLLLMYHPDRYRAGRIIYPRGFTTENLKAVSQFLTARLRNPDVVS